MEKPLPQCVTVISVKLSMQIMQLSCPKREGFCSSCWSVARAFLLALTEALDDRRRFRLDSGLAAVCAAVIVGKVRGVDFSTGS